MIAVAAALKSYLYIVLEQQFRTIVCKLVYFMFYF